MIGLFIGLRINRIDMNLSIIKRKIVNKGGVAANCVDSIR